MKKLRPKGVPVGLIIGLLLLTGWVYIVNTAMGEDKTPKTQKEDIAQLIKQLGNNDWQTRESAQRELIKIGEPSLFFTEKALTESDDQEIKLRAQQIIISVNVQRLHKTWKDSWYSIIMRESNKEPQKAGYLSVKLKEAQYEKQDVFVIQEHYKIVLTPELKVETYCTKDRDLSFVYIKLILDDTQKKLVSEFKFKNGKITDYKLPPRDDDQDAKHGETREGMAFPGIPWPPALFPLLTALPLYENTTFNFKSRNAVISSLALLCSSSWKPKEEQSIVIDYQLELTNKEDLKLGKKTVSAYKFKEPKENEFVPLIYYWVSSKDRRLIKASLVVDNEDEKGELEFVLTTKEEALDWWEKNKDKFEDK